VICRELPAGETAHLAHGLASSRVGQQLVNAIQVDALDSDRLCGKDGCWRRRSVRTLPHLPHPARSVELEGAEMGAW
jgi:hypothetical protein